MMARPGRAVARRRERHNDCRVRHNEKCVAHNDRSTRHNETLAAHNEDPTRRRAAAGLCYAKAARCANAESGAAPS